MKIEYYDGCKMGIEVDNNNFYDLSYEEQKEILHKIINKASEDTLFEMLKDACEIMGEFKEQGYCETCDSTNFSYTIEI